MKPEGYESRHEEIGGWKVHIVSYQLGDRWLCKIDNVDPGALIARADGDTRERAESLAREKAERRLAQTRRS